MTIRRTYATLNQDIVEKRYHVEEGMKPEEGTSRWSPLYRLTNGRRYTNEQRIVDEHREMRQELRQMLYEHGIRSNPGVGDDWIIEQLRRLVENGSKK